MSRFYVRAHLERALAEASKAYALATMRGTPVPWETIAKAFWRALEGK